MKKYLRSGVQTNKSLKQIRAEALAAERWERRQKYKRAVLKIKEFLGYYLGPVFSFIMPSPETLIRVCKILTGLLLSPIAGIMGLLLGISMCIGAPIADGKWPWER